MTVAEMIEALRAMPQDAVVVTYDHEYLEWRKVTRIERVDATEAAMERARHRGLPRPPHNAVEVA